MGFRRVYNRGGEGAWELITVLKSVLKTSYMEVLIKILFFFSVSKRRKNVEFISILAKGELIS